MAAIIAVAAAGLLLLTVLLLVVVSPPGLNVSIADGATEVLPDSQSLDIGASRWGASLDSLQVTETRITADGTLESERVLEGHLQDGSFVLSDGSNPLQPDSRYSVTISGTVKGFGVSGLQDSPQERIITFTTISTPMPVIPAAGIAVKYGQPLNLEWNIPVNDFEYRLEGISSTMNLDDEGRVATFKLEKFEQGKEYPLQITSATSQNGRDLKAPIATVLKTAAPLTATFDPADATPSVNSDVHPAITFSEPVANPEKVETAVSIEPRMDGTWSWVAPDKLEFTPAAEFEHNQDVTITVKGGPQQLRGAGGGFLDADARASFTAAPDKSVDVDVTNQTVTLLENGKPIESFLCSTGAVPHETPLGDYTIYAKLPTTDMRGPGYFAPKVPWVMVFKGDFTMHGNYWATSFGRPSSHGCVGLPVDTAKHVYDWLPIGTPIHIHR